MRHFVYSKWEHGCENVDKLAVDKGGRISARMLTINKRKHTPKR